MENISLSVSLDDGDSSVDARYTLTPQQVAQAPETVGRLLHMLADRVVHSLGLPAPEPLVEYVERPADPSDDEPDAGQPVDPLPLDYRLERIQMELEALGSEQSTAAAATVRSLRNQLTVTAGLLGSAQLRATVARDAQRQAGNADPAERLTGHLDALDQYPLVQLLQALEQEQEG